PKRGAEQPAHHEHRERLQGHGHRGAGERQGHLGRGRDEGGAEQHGKRAAGGEGARWGGEGDGLRLGHQSISTLRATALPPPRHRVASPVVCCLSLRAYKSVVRTRAPEAPIGWPRAMAPPFTLTRAQSHPRARPSASACTANASFASIRSQSEIFVFACAIRRRTATMGAKNRSLGSPPPVA